MVSSIPDPSAAVFIGIDFHSGREDCIVHAVMGVKVRDNRIAHTITAHIGFVGQNQSGTYHIHSSAGILIVMTDGGGHGDGVFQRHSQTFQNLEGENRAAVRMVISIDAVSDIVHITSNLGQFDLMFVISQIFQDFSGSDGDFCRMFLSDPYIQEPQARHFLF